MVKHMHKYKAGLGRDFRAPADPGRRRMVERLCRGPASVIELARPLDMTLSAVVQHLEVLVHSGMVRSSKLGRVRTCRLRRAALRQPEDRIAGLREFWERQSDKPGEAPGEGEEDPA